MNRAEVIHAGWAHEDPSNMSLKKRSQNGSKSQNVGNETAVASNTKNSTLAVQQNPTLSSELHKTSRFSFQPSAHAEHGASNSTLLTSNFQ